MMTDRQYWAFRNRIDPIIRACSVPEAEKGRLPKGDLATYCGKTSFTDKKVFYFSTSRARAYQKELLNICRGLPKMDAVIPGSACTITSLELVKRNRDRAALNAQLVTAEQFFALLTLAGISVFRNVTSRTGLTYLNADIMYDFKDIVAP